MKHDLWFRMLGGLTVPINLSCYLTTVGVYLYLRDSRSMSSRTRG